ncbi:MAG TPA: thiamine pyrophosphate-dependent enzyme [Chloroflexota bacterium]|jgi:benzoylformate decarboxylase/acetolactate synthase-1/2/3 large subunit
MASKASNGGVQRRSFLKGAAAAGAAAVGGGLLATNGAAAESATPAAPARVTSAGTAKIEITRRPGSDFMVDVMKSLGIDYVCSNPGSSFRSLQESIINYGGNSAPEFITCTHEEASVAMAHGYAKAAGKPISILAHSTVGLQHASMAVYNAWGDRVPILLMAGNILDAAARRPGVEWYHCAQDPASLLRDFIKWDDQPVSLQHFAESMVRAYKIATTPPMEPVLVIADADLQERPVEDEAELSIPKLTPTIAPMGDANAVREAARWLAQAENPLIIADRAARTPEGAKLLTQLAETLNAPVVDLGGRMNMSNEHFANLSGMKGPLVREADVVLALEVSDLWGQLNTVTDPTHEYRRIAKPDVKVISISVADLYGKSNYQDFQRFISPDLSIAGDSEATLPPLIDEVRRAASGRLSLLSQRSDKLRSMYQDMKARALRDAAYAWDASPISTARAAAEVWAAIKGSDWALVAGNWQGWAHRLWKFTEYHQALGGSGSYGVGYNLPASVGAALANKSKGLLSVSCQPDGDAMYQAGSLWTAAHHRIPLLTVMHNNRAYHQEMMHLQKMAGLHDRRPDQAKIGTAIEDPNIDYAKLAQSMGVWAEGPITDPADLGPALQRAVAVVKSGYPALVDVVSQPR